MSAVYTGAGGQNVSPDLSWDAPPAGTKSLAITCYDPDAPTTVGFSHWVLFNLPADLGSLPAGAGAAGKTPKGAMLGFTDYGESAYGGMAPPPGDPAHRYQFTVYALDVPRLEGADERTTYAKFRLHDPRPRAGPGHADRALRPEGLTATAAPPASPTSAALGCVAKEPRVLRIAAHGPKIGVTVGEPLIPEAERDGLAE